MKTNFPFKNAQKKLFILDRFVKISWKMAMAATIVVKIKSNMRNWILYRQTH